jgi:SAM-dependent methyltransferase
VKDVLQMLGADLADLLGSRIPADHSRAVLADEVAAGWFGKAGRPHAPRVLDLGCGAGDSVDLFRSLDSHVQWTGADIDDSPEVAQRTRSDAEFVTFDGRQLPFGDRSFDLVYCKQVLEHVRHPAPLLTEVARVLRPEGAFVGSTSHLEAFHSRSVWNYTPYGLMLLLEEAGLDLIEVRPVIDAFTLVTWRALGTPRFFARWWAHESPPYRAISLLAKATRWDHHTVNTAKLTLTGQFTFLAHPAQRPD